MYTLVHALFCVVFVAIAFIVLYLVEGFSPRGDGRGFLQALIPTYFLAKVLQTVCLAKHRQLTTRWLCFTWYFCYVVWVIAACTKRKKDN